jgi:hypothetical protein
MRRLIKNYVYFGYDLNVLTNLIINHSIDFSYFYFITIYKKENIPLKKVLKKWATEHWQFGVHLLLKKCFSERGVTREGAPIIRGSSLFAVSLGTHPPRISREHCTLLILMRIVRSRNMDSTHFPISLFFQELAKVRIFCWQSNCILFDMKQDFPFVYKFLEALWGKRTVETENNE